MAIAACDVPAERREFCLKIPEIARFRHPDVRLELIVIDNDRDGVEAVIGGREERFPNLALLQLAVAGEDEDAPVAAKALVGEHYPLGLRDAHAKGAGVGDDVGRARDVWVAGKTTEAAELPRRFGRKPAAGDHRGVEAWRVMT